MAKNFGEAEHYILSLFKVGTKFHYHGEDYVVILSGKPKTDKGEPKTDIYIMAESIYKNRDVREFKISFKKNNADFLENKINEERAKQLFGKNWDDIISHATYSLRKKFLSRQLIYHTKSGKTDAGAITMGWKFELLNKESGQLSGDMQLSRKQVIDVYAGTNLSKHKRNASVNGNMIPNSGIAEYILFENKSIRCAQDAIDAMMDIKDYVDKHPRVYFACKALNYRSFANKYDGNRPLAVYVHWYVKNGKLTYDIVFDKPLQICGDDTFAYLQKALQTLNVKNTDDLKNRNMLY